MKPLIQQDYNLKFQQTQQPKIFGKMVMAKLTSTRQRFREGNAFQAFQAKCGVH
jgi:hypothetical protein